MSRKIELERTPYDDKVKLFAKKTITFEPGVTVLVGCNGIGKTTLLNQIEGKLKKENIPCISYDNLSDGGSSARSGFAFDGNFALFATSICSSEGENIMLNMCTLASKLRSFVEHGIVADDKYKRLTDAFTRCSGEEVTDDVISSNERWILLDAVDSGFSIDNIVDLKESLFKTILANNFEKDIYIIVSANEYEMASGERCLDVYNCEYRQLKTYTSYKKLILKTAEEKRARKIIAERKRNKEKEEKNNKWKKTSK